MKLIGSLTSPFARKARMILLEKQLSFEFELDIPWEATTRVPNRNPLGKIPVLVLENGFSVFDSSVIAEYADHLSSASPLLPLDFLDRIAVRRWEALTDGAMEAVIEIFLESKYPEAERRPAWIDRQMDKITRSLVFIVQELGDKPYCHGSAFSLADIGLSCLLGYLDLRLPDFAWRTAYPTLAAWLKEMEQRPAFSMTIPPAV